MKRYNEQAVLEKSLQSASTKYLLKRKDYFFHNLINLGALALLGVLSWSGFSTAMALPSWTALSFQDFYFHWEKGHLDHHRKAVEEKDPQNCPSFCLSGKELLRELIKVNFVPLYAGIKQNECSPKEDRKQSF